jgi:ATP-dependent Clp protease ATP-binding subunit ClpC
VSKRSLRVHVVVHEGGRRTARLIRVWDEWFDRPAPSAYGRSQDDLFEELEAKLEALVIEDPNALERFLWSESFGTQRVRVDVHPLTTVKKRAVIGKRVIPLLLTYAYCPLKGGGFRVMLPRFGAWFIVEELSLAPALLRHAVSTFLLGEKPRWVYDFREVGEEHIAEWSPPLLSRVKSSSSAEAKPDPHAELLRVGEDLVERAARGKLAPVVGESPVFDSIKGWTLGLARRSLLLVGPPGSGKSALVRRIAMHHVAARKEATVEPARIYSTSRDRVIAGMVYLGMWQARCLALVKELTDDGDYVHFDALAGLIEAQPDGASIADFLEPAMHELNVIAECTPEELERARRARPSFVRRFTIVRVDEPPPPDIMALGLAYARKRGLDVHPSAMKRLVRHLGALERGVAFPGKALRFLDWLARQQGEGRAAHDDGAPRTVFPRDVSEAYSRYSGVPLSLLSDDVAAGVDVLAATLKARVIGQDAACDACGRVLARLKANLVDPERPLGVLMFVGPTGVGKTELAKQLARTTFGGEERMIRLDMSEYMLPGAVHRLTSARAGTRSLASRVREQPLSLVLLDEIEKAHPEVFDLLLGVLGEGRLTDDAGRFVDFRTTLVVMTSNLGVTDARPVGFGEAEGGDFTRTVRAHFRPELYNRIDQVLAFRGLAVDDVERIVDLEIAAAAKRAGLARRTLRLSVTADARRWLAQEGYHPTRGARPLRRLVEEVVITPIAARIAAEPDLRDRDVVVSVDGDGGRGSDDRGGPLRVSMRA